MSTIAMETRRNEFHDCNAYYASENNQKSDVEDPPYHFVVLWIVFSQKFEADLIHDQDKVAILEK